MQAAKKLSPRTPHMATSETNSTGVIAELKSVGRLESDFEGTRNLISSLTQAVISPTIKAPRIGTSDNLQAILKAANLIDQAVKDGTLTESEGEAISRVLAESFATHQLDRIFERVAEEPRFEWFVSRSTKTSY